MKKIHSLVIFVATLIAVIAGVSTYYFFVREDASPVTESKTCTTYEGQVEEQCAEDYIGLTEEDAIARAEQYGYLPKAAEAGELVTDENGYIIYLVIEEGVVVKAYFEDGRPQR